MAAPRVCISILNWNGYATTAACLESLRALDYANYTVIVLDNASRDGSAARLRAAFPGVTLIVSDENRGFAGGHHRVADHVLRDGAAELIWLLNNDTAPHPDALSVLVEAYAAQGAALYGSVTVDDADRIVFGGGWDLNPATGNPRYAGYNRFAGQPYGDVFGGDSRSRIVADVNGSSLLIPVSVIRQHGFMDESFFMYGEETDYCLRLARRGVPSILVPRSVVTHQHGGSSSTHPRLVQVLRAYYRRRSELIVKRRYRGRRLFYRAVWGEFRQHWRRWLLAAVSPRRALARWPEDYYHYLAARDAVLNRLGKRLPPENYVES